MSDGKKLIRLQKEMRELQNLEMKTRGALGSLCKGLAKDIDKPGLSIDEINDAVKQKVGELKVSIKKAQKLFNEKMSEIDKMAEELEE